MSHHISKGKETQIDFKNKMGEGAKVAAVLAEAGVNITGMIGYSITKSKARMFAVLDDPAKGKKALRKAGYQVTDNDVVLAHLPNRPGAFAKAAAKLAAAKVDIDYAYATAATKKTSLMVFRVNSPAKAIKALL